jgi:hypothetical protein
MKVAGNPDLRRKKWNELPRLKQRGIKKNRDHGRRKQRGIKPVEAVPKAFFKSLIFFTLNFIWLLAQLRLTRMKKKRHHELL